MSDRDYVVLRKRADGAWDFLGNLVGDSSGDVEMRSVDAMDSGGEYIAVPQRYWMPVEWEIVRTRLVRAVARRCSDDIRDLHRCLLPGGTTRRGAHRAGCTEERSVTPDELRALADDARPWELLSFGNAVGVRKYSDAQGRLIYLAPDLARLCAELAEASRMFVAAMEDMEIMTVEPSYVPFEDALHAADAALAKLAELEAR